MKYKDILAFARQLRKNQTPAEKFFWEKVRNNRFLGKKFNRQFIIQHLEFNGDAETERVVLLTPAEELTPPAPSLTREGGRLAKKT